MLWFLSTSFLLNTNSFFLIITSKYSLPTNLNYELKFWKSIRRVFHIWLSCERGFGNRIPWKKRRVGFVLFYRALIIHLGLPLIHLWYDYLHRGRSTLPWLAMHGRMSLAFAVPFYGGRILVDNRHTRVSKALSFSSAFIPLLPCYLDKSMGSCWSSAIQNLVRRRNAPRRNSNTGNPPTGPKIFVYVHRSSSVYPPKYLIFFWEVWSGGVAAERAAYVIILIFKRTSHFNRGVVHWTGDGPKRVE